MRYEIAVQEFHWLTKVLGTSSAIDITSVNILRINDAVLTKTVSWGKYDYWRRISDTPEGCRANIRADTSPMSRYYWIANGDWAICLNPYDSKGIVRVIQDDRILGMVLAERLKDGPITHLAEVVSRTSLDHIRVDIYKWGDFDLLSLIEGDQDFRRRIGLGPVRR